VGNWFRMRDGSKAALDERGYLRRPNGTLVHREVYSKVHGPIPKQWVVHHVNFLKTDNRIANLIALPEEIHNRIHREMKKTGVKMGPREILSLVCDWMDPILTTYPKICEEIAEIETRYQVQLYRLQLLREKADKLRPGRELALSGHSHTRELADKLMKEPEFILIPTDEVPKKMAEPHEGLKVQPRSVFSAIEKTKPREFIRRRYGPICQPNKMSETLSRNTKILVDSSNRGLTRTKERVVTDSSTPLQR